MPPHRSHRRNYNDPGHAHELTFSCYQRYPLLQAERTCQWLAESIEAARTECNFDLWAYVFMPEHVHLIVHPRDAEYDMARIRKTIKSPVGSRAMRFLEQHSPEWLDRVTRRRGKKTERLFWQSGGGHDRNVIEARTLMKMIEYLHLNPVRRGLAERAEEWKWSSAAWFLGVGESPIALDRVPPEWLGLQPVISAGGSLR